MCVGKMDIRKSIACILALLATVLIVDCAGDDDLPVNKEIWMNARNVFTEQYGYWIVDDNKVDDCTIVLNDDQLTFSSVPWRVICAEVFEDVALSEASLVNGNNGQGSSFLTLKWSRTGYASNKGSVYYVFEPTTYVFDVMIEGETYQIEAYVTGTAMITYTPSRMLTSTLIISEIAVDGIKKTLHTPLKLVHVAPI